MKMNTSSKITATQEDVYKQLQNFGRFQFIQYVLICIPIVIVSMMNVNYIFVAEDVDHRCRVVECETEDSKLSVQLPSWWPDNADAKCFKPLLDSKEYSQLNQTCTNSSFLEQLEECDEWIYESNNSIVAELNLGCQPWKATLVGSIHNAGMIVSMLLMGWIADKFGRKTTVIICSVGGCVGILKLFLNNYYAYLAVEFMESLISSGLYTVGIVLMVEVGGESKRVTAGVIFSYAVYLGEMLFALLAMGLKYWKYLIIVIYSPAILLLLYVFVLRESTRWQMLRGKMDPAKSTFKLIAKINKLDISASEMDDISGEELRSKLDVEIQNDKENIKDIICSKEIMRRLAVTSFCFFTSGFVYYGLAVHSVLLPGNKYTNFVLTSLTSFPGDLLAFYTFDKIGRRISLQGGFIICAIFLLAQAYSPDSLPWLKVLMFLFGKLGIALCFTGIYTYSLELFPTSVRGSLVGCGNTGARIGSLFSPLTSLLISEFESLPSILFASTAVIAAFLLIFTPETKNLPMFDTIAQVEAYKKKMSAIV